MSGLSAASATSPPAGLAPQLPSYAARARAAGHSTPAASSPPRGPSADLSAKPAPAPTPLAWGTVGSSSSSTSPPFVPAPLAPSSSANRAVSSGNGSVDGEPVSSANSASGSVPTPAESMTPASVHASVVGGKADAASPPPPLPTPAAAPVPNAWAARQAPPVFRMPQQPASAAVRRAPSGGASMAPPNLDDESSWPSAEAASAAAMAAASSNGAKSPGSPTPSVSGSVNGSKEKKKQKWTKIEADFTIAGQLPGRHPTSGSSRPQTSNAASPAHSRSSSSAPNRGDQPRLPIEDRAPRAYMAYPQSRGMPPWAQQGGPSYAGGPMLPHKPSPTNSAISSFAPRHQAAASTSDVSSAPRSPVPFGSTPSEPRSRTSTYAGGPVEGEPTASFDDARSPVSAGPSFRHPPAPLSLPMNGYGGPDDRGLYGGGFNGRGRGGPDRGRGAFRARGRGGRGGYADHRGGPQPPLSPQSAGPMGLPMSPIEAPYGEPPSGFYYGPQMGYGMPASFYPGHFPAGGIPPTMLGAGPPGGYIPGMPPPQHQPQPPMHGQPFQIMPPSTGPTESWQRPPPLQVYDPPLDPTRHWVLGQIEYYLSAENLSRDTFLRQQMGSDGFIDLNIIASFPRVRALSIDLGLIRESLTLSPILEVEGMKVRRKHDWERWLLPTETSSSPSVAADRSLSSSPPPSSIATAAPVSAEMSAEATATEETTVTTRTTFTNPTIGFEPGTEPRGVSDTDPAPQVTAEVPVPETVGNRQPTVLIGDVAPPPRRMRMSRVPRRGVPIESLVAPPAFPALNLGPHHP